VALSRERALRIRWILDNVLPPLVRDSRWLMLPLMRLVFGARYRTFAEFKAHGFAMSAQEFSRTYAHVADLTDLQGETDLNNKCVQAIVAAIWGDTVLDAGCGRGFLAKRLAEQVPDVVGCDIVLGESLASRPGLRFVEGSVEHLPFDDASFDTVVCTHTLEHTQHIDLALAELRRVAARRLIIVVPKERPYRFSFNLHLHFFPYPWSWRAVAGTKQHSELRDLDDWFYVEEIC
jgi:SAM-dependent methyltransferase